MGYLLAEMSREERSMNKTTEESQMKNDTFDILASHSRKDKNPSYLLSDHSALLSSHKNHSSDFSLKDKSIMLDLMQKINKVTVQTESSHGLALGMTQSLCKRLGERGVRVIPQLNETYLLMHNFSNISFNQTQLVGKSQTSF